MKMPFNLSTNNLLIILATLVVAAGAYWYFFTGTGNDVPLSTGGAGNPAQAQFQSLVGQLSPITFNTSIFADSRFNALVDLATPVAPESAGRIDPFATVPGITGTGSAK